VGCEGEIGRDAHDADGRAERSEGQGQLTQMHNSGYQTSQRRRKLPNDTPDSILDIKYYNIGI